MAFRRRRPFVRRFRPPQQLNWATAFSDGAISVPAGTSSVIPLTLPVEQETGSDQVIQRVRGSILSAAPIAGAPGVGDITYSLFVESAKDVALSLGALPDPRGATLEAVEPDKYMLVTTPWAFVIAGGVTNLVGSLNIDVKAKRKIDVSYEQLLLRVDNPSASALSLTFYIRTLLKEV